MTDESLVAALASLRTARMSEAASDRVRHRLENAWRGKAARSRSRFFATSFVRAAVVAMSIVMLANAAVHAGAETALYSARVALEDALVAWQPDPLAYLTQLYDERVAEAARQDAVGNALAASRARAATRDALRLIARMSPQQGEEVSPSPEPSAPAIMLPSRSPEQTPTQAPTATPTPTPEPPTPAPVVVHTPTPKPETPKPTPPPAPSQFAVHATGTVVYADGTLVNDACVSQTLGGTCIATVKNGNADFWVIARRGDVLTFYVQKVDIMTGRTYKGKVIVTVEGPTLLLGKVTLRPA